MKTIKKLTKPLTLYFAILAIVSCFSITASAASKSASLSTSDKIAYSGVIKGKQCKYSGKNDSLSAGNVYFLAKNNHGGVWSTDVSHDLAKGKSFSNNTTTKYSSSCSWELVLNPKGGNAYGCIASGTITSI